MGQKDISTLIPDIEDVLVNGVEEVSEELLDKFANEMKELLRKRLTKTPPREFSLYMSNIGTPCTRKLWLEKNYPEQKEPFDASAILKFLYGDVLESLLLTLSELAGHRVEGQQDRAEIAGIRGRRDAVIDGVLVDVKSASSYSFKKFKDGGLRDDDPFGYIIQLQSYLQAAQTDDLVTEKSRGAFFVVDKVLGHLCLDFHQFQDYDLSSAFEQRKEIVSGTTIPDRKYEDEPDGKSGNRKLGISCSYCPVKSVCWDGLRTFISSRGPVYLSHVEREPRMLEVTNNSKTTSTESSQAQEETFTEDRSENSEE